MRGILLLVVVLGLAGLGGAQAPAPLEPLIGLTRCAVLVSSLPVELRDTGLTGATLRADLDARCRAAGLLTTPTVDGKTLSLCGLLVDVTPRGDNTIVRVSLRLYEVVTIERTGKRFVGVVYETTRYDLVPTRALAAEVTRLAGDVTTHFLADWQRENPRPPQNT